MLCASSFFRDVQGKSIINFCISLGIGLLVLVIMKLMTYYDMGWCAARGKQYCHDYYFTIIRTYKEIFTMIIICFEFPIFRYCCKCYEHG